MVQLYFPAKHHFLEGPLSHSHTASDKIIKTRSGKSSPNWCFFSHAADSESQPVWVGGHGVPSQPLASEKAGRVCEGWAGAG